jgi:hypothetical protein
MPITITPNKEHPVPKSFKDQNADTLRENARAAANSASLMVELGMPFEMTESDEEEARKLFQEFDKKKGEEKDGHNPPALYDGAVSIKLAALLDAYDKQVVTDAVQVRTFITNRLLELSSCGVAKDELRALELLGKMSDVGAFTEKSEITITHRTSDDLRKAIEDKIHRMLGNDVIDVQPVSITEELGLLESVNADEPTRSSEATAIVKELTELT